MIVAPLPIAGLDVGMGAITKELRLDAASGVSCMPLEFRFPGFAFWGLRFVATGDVSSVGS